MSYIGSHILARELKKGSAELLILSLVEERPRHGYDIGSLIEQRSGGALRFNVASLYPLLYRLERRGWIQGRWVESAGKRLSGLKLRPTREAEIVEELSQHLEDRYEQSLRGGATEEEAYRAALRELTEGELLAEELRRVERPARREPVAPGSPEGAN